MNPESEPFYEAAGQGRLLLKTCADCGKCHYYPRVICPLCGSANTSWMDARGTGDIYSYSVTRRGVPNPFVIAYVRLDEGVTVLTNIVDCDVDKVGIGDRVKVTFRPLDEKYSLPVFAPVTATEDKQ
ncbi:MAG: Zn-ribbon domain-containing OB-fold protein [Pseudomonadota bacterium]